MDGGVDLKRFSGGFLVWRLSARGFRRRDGGGAKLPHFRHPTLEAAETEAVRLTTLWPESTFVVIQEVSRAKAVEGARHDE